MHMFPSYTPENGQMVSAGEGMRIIWQEGPFMEAGRNGSMLEQPIRAVLNRLEDLDAKLPCPQNVAIKQHLWAILGLLDERTRERNNRGVLGTRAV